MVSRARNLTSRGEKALEEGKYELALECFALANQRERTPRNSSNLAFCLAKVRGDFQGAFSLALEALHLDPDNPLHYLNFGRILLLAGHKEQAIQFWRKGLGHGKSPVIEQELEAVGIRKPPVFKSLPRNHFLNRCAGLVGSRLSLR